MTEFLENYWYVAGLDSMMPPVSRRVVLGHPIVLFRTSDGQVSALEDWCPHRGVPLSLGEVVEDALQCPYHGLSFDRNGTCVKNPHVKGTPDALKARSIPCRLRQGTIWVWIGDPDLVDEGRVPVYADFEPEAGFEVVEGYLNIKAGYRLLIDNLLDLSHAEFIHSKSLGTPNAAASVSTRAVSREDGVTVERRARDVLPSPLFKPVWGKSERVDQVSDMSWAVPSSLSMDIFVTFPDGAREDGLCMPMLHLLTPETDGTTHYHWRLGRNFNLGDGAYSARLVTTVTNAFVDEDAPVIEAIQRNLDCFGSKRPLANFTVGDAGSRRARKMIQDRLLVQEAARGIAEPLAASV